MGKQKSLHKSSRDYDTSNPTYACGTPVEHNPNLTDAQAMAMPLCTECFPNGMTAVDVRIEAEEEPTVKPEACGVVKVGNKLVWV